MKRWHYITLTIVSYLFFVVANTPAATVLGWIKKSSPLPVSLYGVDGSIWNGHADTVILRNQTRITQLDWSINPLLFFAARLSADVTAQMYQQGFSAHIQAKRDGSILIEDFQSRLPAKDVQQLIDLPLGELGGQFDLNLEEIIWLQNTLQNISGNIIWNSANITLGNKIELGIINIECVTDDKNTITLTIKNTGGMLTINGTLAVEQNQNYNADISFKIHTDTPVDVVQSIGMFAPRQTDGSHRFKQSGNLYQLGL